MPESRSALVAVTSVLFYTVGMLVTTAGFAIVGIAGVAMLGTMFGVVIPSEFVARLPFVGTFAGLGVDWLLGLGTLFVVAGILELGAGSRLWNVRRSGAKLGVTALVLSIVASVFFLPLRPIGEVVGLAGLIASVALLGLLAGVWRRLQ